jgi:hypothetical protein
MTLVNITCPRGHKFDRLFTEEELKRVGVGEFVLSLSL